DGLAKTPRGPTRRTGTPAGKGPAVAPECAVGMGKPWEINDENVRRRMIQLGVPLNKQGDLDAAQNKNPTLIDDATAPKIPPTGVIGAGGLNNGKSGGISLVNHDIHDPHLMGTPPTPWSRATPQERADAVIIHEKVESKSKAEEKNLFPGTNDPRHQDAIRKAPAEADKLPVSDNTKAILNAMNPDHKG